MPEQILDLECSGISLRRYRSQRPLRHRLLSSLRRRVGLIPASTKHPLYDWIRAFNPDLIVCSGDCLQGYPVIKMASILRIPYAYIMHANSESWWPSDDQAIAMYNVLDEVRGAICFVSQRNKELFELQLGRRVPNSYLVRNPHYALGMDTLPWPDASQGCISSDSGNTLRLAMVGRLEPIAKGQDILFQVLVSPQWQNRDWHLTLFGSGDGSEGVKRMVEMLGIVHRTTFVASYSSLHQVWSHNHVLIMPSRYEGLPLALVEAMWLGRPAVATSVADIPLLLRDGIDGFLASAATVPNFAEAMERLWVNRNQLPAMGQSAALRARAYLPADPVGETSRTILSLAESSQQ